MTATRGSMSAAELLNELVEDGWVQSDLDLIEARDKALLAEKDARIERLEKALEGIKAMPCLAALLGEENPECGCASCTAREALKR